MNPVGREEGVPEKLVHDVVGEELPPEGLKKLLHPFPPQGPLPVGDHVVHAHEVLPRHDGLPLGEEGEAGVGPGIPAVQDQRPPSLRLHPGLLVSDEGGEGGEASHGAEGLGQGHEVQVGEEVGEGRPPGHPVVAKDGLPREVPGAAHEGLGGDEVGGLHEVVGKGLAVEVGEVEEGALPKGGRS